MTTVWQTIGRSLLDLLYPRFCEDCGEPVRALPDFLCWSCRLEVVPIRPPFCARCGDPVEGVTGKPFLCALCTREPPPFDLARSAVRYRGPIRPLLHRFKYADGLHLAPMLTDLLAMAVETHYDPTWFDFTVYVPLYPPRERRRTYNQSQLLAERLARRYGIPVFRGIERTRDTGTQTRLSMGERARNVRDAFAVRDPAWAEGKRFLLVDDVMTTGATLREVARALKQAGAERVWAATVARGG